MLRGMGLIQLYATATTLSSPTPSTTNISSSTHSTSDWQDDSMAFCNCNYTNDKSNSHPTKRFAPYGSCYCGEDACKTIDWIWDSNLIQPPTIVADQTVSFHPCYSQGTSIVRGETALQKGMIHYWEIKIVSWYSGTDLMIGIGTNLVDLLEHRYKFSSALGLDDKSWGYSHRGLVQHKNVLKYYGKPFTSQCIVGVYLDLFKGHLEFYINRIPQGIVYRNIPLDNNLEIYPMVCSTSAKSSVKLINASSFKECLQFRCMKVITKYPQLLDKVQQMPGLSYLCKNLWYLLPKERYQYSQNNNNNNHNHTIRKTDVDIDMSNIETDSEHDDNDVENVDFYGDSDVEEMFLTDI